MRLIDYNSLQKVPLLLKIVVETVQFLLLIRSYNCKKIVCGGGVRGEGMPSISVRNLKLK